MTVNEIQNRIYAGGFFTDMERCPYCHGKGRKDAIKVDLTEYSDTLEKVGISHYNFGTALSRNDIRSIVFHIQTAFTEFKETQQKEINKESLKYQQLRREYQAEIEADRKSRAAEEKQENYLLNQLITENRILKEDNLHHRQNIEKGYEMRRDAERNLTLAQVECDNAKHDNIKIRKELMDAQEQLRKATKERDEARRKLQSPSPKSIPRRSKPSKQSDTKQTIINLVTESENGLAFEELIEYFDMGESDLYMIVREMVNTGVLDTESGEDGILHYLRPC